MYKAFGQTFIDDDHFLAFTGAFAALFNSSGEYNLRDGVKLYFIIKDQTLLWGQSKTLLSITALIGAFFLPFSLQLSVLIREKGSLLADKTWMNT